MLSSSLISDPPRMLDRRQAAAERIEQLDKLVASVDGKRFKAADVFGQAAEAIIDIVPASTTFERVVEGQRTRLFAVGDPQAVDGSEPERWTGLYKLSDRESLELSVSHEAADEFSQWRDTFFDSILDCCGVAFLKERYYLASSTPVAIQTKPTRRLFLPMLVAVVVGALAMLIPVRFRLPVSGVVAPAVSRVVFAPTAGTLASLEVQDGQAVQEGDVLAIVDQADIELQHDRLHGELLTAETELASARVDQARPQASGSPNPGSTHSAVLQARVRSLQRQVELIDQVYSSLTIRAAINGQVVMQDTQADWAGKSVMQSQALMTVIQPSGGFLAHLDLPSDQFAYLGSDFVEEQDSSRAAQPGGSQPTAVQLRLRSAPEVELAGRVVSVGQTVFVDKHHESVVEVTAGLDSIDNGPLRVGAAVIGHVELGKRSLGFVLFRPLIERIRSLGW
ncbi:efflux RND transporter periplasmic adaptor subunit [Neorhodopirellula lusitana]|uniref:efflux RND transporter periplasmic adaptor subunit n=1 Tax=Neorhodopirellula lusitana TaxID=445327 RepID=UPI00384AF230